MLDDKLDLPVAAAEVRRRNGGRRSVPTIVFPDGSALVESSDRALGARLVAFSGAAPAAEMTGGSTTRAWPGQSVAARSGASVVASLC